MIVVQTSRIRIPRICNLFILSRPPKPVLSTDDNIYPEFPI